MKGFKPLIQVLIYLNGNLDMINSYNSILQGLNRSDKLHKKLSNDFIKSK